QVRGVDPLVPDAERRIPDSSLELESVLVTGIGPFDGDLRGRHPGRSDGSHCGGDRTHCELAIVIVAPALDPSVRARAQMAWITRGHARRLYPPSIHILDQYEPQQSMTPSLRTAHSSS